jgi:hypothetical protein
VTGNSAPPVEQAPCRFRCARCQICRMSEFTKNCRWTADYGISDRHAAHSAQRLSPPAGTTRIAAIVRSASPHRRQIILSPARPARAQCSAIAAGSSISSTRIKFRSVSKDSPHFSHVELRRVPRSIFCAAYRTPRQHPPPISAAVLPIEHDAQSIPAIRRPESPVAALAESRDFRARAGPDARWSAAARPRPDWRYLCG